mgnify:CR=1 FL=1
MSRYRFNFSALSRPPKRSAILENTSDRTLRIRPIHQVSPINAARHFGMKVCFCFNDQDIEPHGTREFPVIYAFAPALDRRIETVTLCYSLFDVAPGAARSTDMERIEREVRYGEGAVGLVPFATVEQGAGAIRQAMTRLAESGRRYAIVDAVSDGHLMAIGDRKSVV